MPGGRGLTGRGAPAGTSRVASSGSRKGSRRRDARVRRLPDARAREGNATPRDAEAAAAPGPAGTGAIAGLGFSGAVLDGDRFDAAAGCPCTIKLSRARLPRTMYAASRKASRTRGTNWRVESMPIILLLLLTSSPGPLAPGPLAPGSRGCNTSTAQSRPPRSRARRVYKRPARARSRLDRGRL